MIYTKDTEVDLGGIDDPFTEEEIVKAIKDIVIPPFGKAMIPKDQLKTMDSSSQRLVILSFTMDILNFVRARIRLQLWDMTSKAIEVSISNFKSIRVHTLKL